MTASRMEAIDLVPGRLPPSEFAYRPFLVASLAMATLVGFVLGIHVPLGRLLDTGSPERTADLIQAHGQVQLLGFAGLFVIGMSLRLMPRFAGARLAFESLVPPALWLFVTGLFVRAVVMPWFSGDLRAVFLIGSLFAVLLGSVCFLFVVFGTMAVDARRFDGSSLAFILGATLLFVASLIATAAAIDALDRDSPRISYLANGAVVQLELGGFLLSFILGVALRAIPTMAGIERPGRSAGVLAAVLAASIATLAAALLYLEYVSYAKAARLAASGAFLSFGLVLLSLAWRAGALRQVANRLRQASQTNLWLVRSAFVWMVVAGLSSAYFGGRALASAELPGEFEFDAVRHALGVGVVTMLIAGMSLLILPEFAGERLGPHRQKALALVLCVLLNAAALLRVLPALAGARWSFDDRNLAMALAGSLAEAAVLIFAVYLWRLPRRTHSTGGSHGR